MSAGPSPQCVITGCAFVSGGVWKPCDVFLLGDTVIAHAPVNATWLPLPASYSKLVEFVGNYFERSNVMVAHESRAIFNQAALDYMEGSPS